MAGVIGVRAVLIMPARMRAVGVFMLDVMRVLVMVWRGPMRGVIHRLVLDRARLRVGVLVLGVCMLLVCMMSFMRVMPVRVLSRGRGRVMLVRAVFRVWLIAHGCLRSG